MSTLSAFLVEDSVLIREELTVALAEMAPIKVVATAEDEESAIEWLLHHQCDLVILDLLLSRGSGVGVLRRLNHMEKKVTVVVLSSYATLPIRRACLDLGAAEVFDKSQDLEQLIEYCVGLAD